MTERLTPAVTSRNASLCIFCVILQQELFCDDADSEKGTDQRKCTEGKLIESHTKERRGERMDSATRHRPCQNRSRLNRQIQCRCHQRLYDSL